MGYGDQEIYSRWSVRSLARWKELLARTTLFQPSGMLWMARERDPLTVKTFETLERLRVTPRAAAAAGARDALAPDRLLTDHLGDL